MLNKLGWIDKKKNYHRIAALLNITVLIIDLVGRVFANDPGDRSSIPGWVISKT